MILDNTFSSTVETVGSRIRIRTSFTSSRKEGKAIYFFFALLVAVRCPRTGIGEGFFLGAFGFM
jgi:hypothetical protein